MTNKNLKQVMNDEWQKVRKNFYYPQLPPPRLVEEIKGNNGSFNFSNLETTVEQPYIESFRGTDIAKTNEESDALVLNETLTHELIHYMKFPGSVLNILKLQKSAQDIADGDKISELRVNYNEAQTNLDLIVNQSHSGTVPISRELDKRGIFPGSLGELHYGLYQQISGQDFGINSTDEEKGLIGKLKDIDYTDKEQEIKNFRKFAQVLKDYQPPQEQDNEDEQEQNGEGNGEGQGQEEGQGNGEGNSEGQGSGKGNKQEKGKGKNGKGNPHLDKGLDMFSDNQIREGLKQFAQECSTPDEYEEIVRQVLGESEEQGQEQQLQAMGKRAGLGRGITQLADNFYTALAEKYTIPISEKPMHKNGSLYPYSHTSFEIGDTITDVDAFSTPGILPGITKKWVKKEGEVYGNDKSIPDSFLIIDSSSSMPSPIEEISVPVLGATAISNAYLQNNSRVAVYNFGGNDYLLQSTKDKEAVHKQLRVYTGGGTTFNSGILEKVLKNSEREYDVSVISDMDIGNLGDFIDGVLEIPQTNRIHLLYTENNDVGQLRKSFGNRENVAILPLTCESDIQKITMGELKKSIY